MNAPRRFAEYDPEICLNCGADLDVDDRFCRDCGQRNRRHARSILAWIAEGLSSLLHLEGKLVNTLRDLPKPGRYAYNYLNGQRERYVHPLRLLLFSSLVCFAAMSAIGWLNGDFDAADVPTDTYAPGHATGGAVASEGGDDTDSARSARDSTSYLSPEAIAERRRVRARGGELRAALDSLRAAREELVGERERRGAVGDSAGAIPAGELGVRIARLVAAEVAGAPDDEIEALEGAVDESAEAIGERVDDRIGELEDELEDLADRPTHPAYERMRQIDRLRADLVAHDRAALLAADLAAAGHAATPEARFVLDTLLATYPMPLGWGEDPPGDGGGGTFSDVSILGQEPRANARLLAVGSPMQVADSMHLEGALATLVAAKAVGMYQDGVESLVGYLFANVSWVVLLFVPLLAFGYLVFYPSRMPYYAQNLAYAAILQSVVLLAITGAVGLTALGLGGVTWGVLALAMGVYAIAGEAHLYGVPWWKATLKNFAIATYGTFALTVAVLVWLFVAVVLL